MGRLTHRTAPGWTYFVTTKAAQNVSVFQVQEIAEIVVGKMIDYRNKGNYLLHDFTLMPNHLHLIVTPSDSVSLERAMQLMKGGSSYEIHRIRGNKMQIWQSGFHESRVLNLTDYKKRADYIHFNPVTAKLVTVPEVWPYGSASGKYQLDPIPQGLKPVGSRAADVGAKAPTPKNPTIATAPVTPELKLRPPEETTTPSRFVPKLQLPEVGRRP
jgi:putative transposase